ncbi:hypothetical protein EGJ34_14290 [Stenotrophomonas sp. 278]|nr:hypothetical protein EGJ34_14290 [Stenotrophomonas sp. 278]
MAAPSLFAAVRTLVRKVTILPTSRGARFWAPIILVTFVSMLRLTYLPTLPFINGSRMDLFDHCLQIKRTLKTHL